MTSTAATTISSVDWWRSARTSSGCKVVASQVELVNVLRAVLDAVDVSELHGGHQARVFRVLRRDGEVIAAKVTDAAMIDRTTFEARIDVVSALGELDHRVCRPLPIGGRLITEIAGDVAPHLLVCYEFAEGDALTTSDAELMGRTLAGLHTSMARLPRAELPSVAALRGESIETPQLLHGDFNSGNLRRRGGAVRVFDLDDCGYGPVEFDVANALYMVLFDSLAYGTPDVYPAFRTSFVAGYRASAGGDVADDALDGFIDRRVDALAGWLDDLTSAPIGIRTATPQWHGTLRSFVATYRTNR